MSEQEKHQQEEVNNSEQTETQAEVNEALEAAQNDTVEESANDANDGDLATQLQAAKEEAAKLNDAYLRAKAEQENIRRRSEKEVANGRKFAIEGFAKELVTVYDSLKMACAVDVAADSSDVVKQVQEGVQITLKQLESAFDKFSLTEITPVAGDKLDPNLHQAMSQVDSDDIDSGCIVNVLQSGFQLHDRLLRPAMVMVAK